MERRPQAAELADRRDAPRVDLDGRYSIRLDPCDGRGLISCALLDYSVTGIRVQLPEDVALPADLQVMVGDLAHNARIVWRNGMTLGVDFVDEHHSIF
jgi:hypothetical protein